MQRILATAILALFTFVTPVRAATIEALDASVNLIFPVGTSAVETVSGKISLTRVDDYLINKLGPYQFSGSDFMRDGNPITQVPIGGGPGGNHNLLFFLNAPNALPPSDIFAIIFADIWNLKFSSFSLNNNVALGGTVTVLSETVNPTPLPAALPLFASGLAGLFGFRFLRRSRDQNAPGNVPDNQ